MNAKANKNRKTSTNRKLKTKLVDKTCLVCGKILKTNRALNNHIRTHTKIRIPKTKILIYCSTCKLGYRDVHDLERHEKANIPCKDKINDPARKYGCNTCRYKFFTTKDLHRHQTKKGTHTIALNWCVNSDRTEKQSNQNIQYVGNLPKVSETNPSEENLIEFESNSNNSNPTSVPDKEDSTTEFIEVEVVNDSEELADETPEKNNNPVPTPVPTSVLTHYEPMNITLDEANASDEIFEQNTTNTTTATNTTTNTQSISLDQPIAITYKQRQFQDEDCSKLNHEKINPCIDCLRTTPGICRFKGFRKIERNVNGTIEESGFGDSQNDPTPTDKELWNLASGCERFGELNMEHAKYIFRKIFKPIQKICDQELKTIKDYVQNNQQSQIEPQRTNPQVLWKPFVEQQREMCDKCQTSLFNVHWVCEKCGLAICIDCKEENENRKAEDIMPCSNGETTHDLNNLSLTEFIPRNVLKNFVEKLVNCEKMLQI